MSSGPSRQRGDPDPSRSSSGNVPTRAQTPASLQSSRSSSESSFSSTDSGMSTRSTSVNSMSDYQEADAGNYQEERPGSLMNRIRQEGSRGIRGPRLPDTQYLNIDMILRAHGLQPHLVNPEDKEYLRQAWLSLKPEQHRQAVEELWESGEEIMRGNDPVQKLRIIARAMDPRLWSRRNPITRQLSTVEKNVFRTIDQEKRDALARYGARTVRGHGGPNELPVLAYISPSGRMNYLNKAQRLACLENRLPNAPTCPNPPTYQELNERIRRIRLNNDMRL